MNKPVAWIGKPELQFGFTDTKVTNEKESWDDIPLYTHPVKPAICVGYWDNKTGAFHKHLTESQQKRVDEGVLQPVYTAGMLPIRELTDEEIMQVADDPSLWRDDGVLRSCIDFAKAILRKAQEK